MDDYYPQEPALPEQQEPSRFAEQTNNAVSPSVRSNHQESTVQALVVGDNSEARLVSDALRAEQFNVDTCNFTSTAFLVSDDTRFDIIFLIARKPLGKLNRPTKQDSMYTELRQRSALIAVAVGEDAEIEPTYLEAGFDGVM